MTTCDGKAMSGGGGSSCGKTGGSVWWGTGGGCGWWGKCWGCSVFVMNGWMVMELGCQEKRRDKEDG